MKRSGTLIWVGIRLVPLSFPPLRTLPAATYLFTELLDHVPLNPRAGRIYPALLFRHRRIDLIAPSQNTACHVPYLTEAILL